MATSLLDRQPAIFSFLGQAVAFVLLVVSARYGLGRNLAWGEVTALFGLVGIGGTVFTWKRVTPVEAPNLPPAVRDERGRPVDVPPPKE